MKKQVKKLREIKFSRWGKAVNFFGRITRRAGRYSVPDSVDFGIAIELLSAIKTTKMKKNQKPKKKLYEILVPSSWLKGNSEYIYMDEITIYFSLN
jgi:hypothetical protein